MNQFEQRFGTAGIPLGSASVLKLMLDALLTQVPAVNAVARHGVICVGDGDDPGQERNVFSGDSLRVAFSVIAFMVVFGSDVQSVDEADVFQYTCADDGVALHELVFFIGELARLVENGIRNADLSDIVQKADGVDVVRLLGGQPQFFGNGVSIFRDAAGMTSCVLVFGIDRIGDGHDRLHGHLADVFILLLELLRVLLIFPLYFVIDPGSKPAAQEAENNESNLNFRIFGIVDGQIAPLPAHPDGNDVKDQRSDPCIQYDGRLVEEYQKREHREYVGKNHRGAAGDHDEDVHHEIAYDVFIAQAVAVRLP